ncbi:hypothetical protein [Actinoplanes sp. NPDC051851]|uniref:hypothetical protein n=1 Tax=Actinoplanes sp. NPDC051851 TaxID=3154753 RepID=UPI003426E036
MRFPRALCALLLVGLVSGCSSSESDDPTFTDPVPSAVPASAAPAWTEPASYTYVLTVGCDADQDRYSATVENGEVTRYGQAGASAAPTASADVDLGPITEDGGEEIEVPSLAQLLDMAQTTADDGGQVSTEYDAADGHPVKVTINVTDEASEAECFGVADYVPGN